MEDDDFDEEEEEDCEEGEEVLFGIFIDLFSKKLAYLMNFCMLLTQGEEEEDQDPDYKPKKTAVRGQKGQANPAECKQQ